MNRDDHKDHESHEDHENHESYESYESCENHEESEKSYSFEECNMKPFMYNYYPMYPQCSANYQMSSSCGMKAGCPFMNEQMSDMYLMPMEYSDESDSRYDEEDSFRDAYEQYPGHYHGSIYPPYYYGHHYHHHRPRPYPYPYPFPHTVGKWYK